MTRVLVILLAALVLAPSAPALAQQSGAACSAIAADAERLACYDGVFRGQGGQPAGEAVVLQSEQLIPARPTGRAPAAMVLSCAAGELRLGFGFAAQLLSATSDNVPVTFTVDQGGNTVRNLPVSPDNTSVGFATATQTTAFLDTLAGATNLKVRITPVRQRSLTVDFRLRDSAAAIAALREACA